MTRQTLADGAADIGGQRGKSPRRSSPLATPNVERVSSYDLWKRLDVRKPLWRARSARWVAVNHVRKEGKADGA